MQMRYYLIININLQNRNLNLETLKMIFFFILLTVLQKRFWISVFITPVKMYSMSLEIK